MALFDFNVALGRSAYPAGGAFDTPDQLLAEMRRLRIDRALVYHRMAAEADVQKGNRLLLELLDGVADLFPCWVMAPAVLHDLPDPGAWVHAAVDRDVRAVRLFPRHSLYPLAEWCAGPLLAALEQAELPLLLDFGLHHWSEDVIPWDSIKVVCEQHPRLDVVVIGATVGDTRKAVPLLHLFPNLYMEYHALPLPDGLGKLAEEGLAGKLIFGTGMPLRAGECVTEQTLRSGLKAAQQRAIAHDNAWRLLGVAEVDNVARLDVDPIVRPPGVNIDVHAHIGSWERVSTPVTRPEDFVASMQRCGVHKMVFSNFSAIHGEMRLGNQETEKAIGHFPEQLYGYAVINPHYPDESESELRRCFEEGEGFVGLKLHCGLHQVQLQDRRYERALAYADEHELPVLVHGGGQDQWGAVAERCPRAAFIIAHACAWDGLNADGRALFGLAREVPNLYVDVAGSAAYRGALRALVDLVGVQKVLFGSDFPMFDLAFELGRVSLSDLNYVEKVAVCGGNAVRVFKRM
ncbi:MAG: amidohydrolase family protein [Candidatus Hydrogenedentes bacterium]|nr:amidohydrolase family protein [Candidatus Hydrogenedentota bacterium]